MHPNVLQELYAVYSGQSAPWTGYQIFTGSQTHILTHYEQFRDVNTWQEGGKQCTPRNPPLKHRENMCTPVTLS